MRTWKDKVVWVSGASSGIGEGIVRKLASLGAKIILSARTSESLEKIKASLPNPENHMCIPLDLEHSSNFPELAEIVYSKMGKIDFLFNNGGLSQRSEVDRRIMEINYFGNIALAKAVLPYFKKQKSGHFVVISSVSGKFGFFLRSAYSASKHALHGFYESLFLEEEKNNIKVTIACPGKINTNISVNALNGEGKPVGKMDHNQATGMSIEVCVDKLIRAVELEKMEILIGNREIKAVTIKRFFPRLFWTIIKKQSAT